MKTLITSIAAIAFAASATAATFNVTTGTGPNVTGIGDSSGVGLVGTGGIAAIGTFSTTDFSTFTSVADFTGAFTAFGTPSSTNFLDAGFFGNSGVFTFVPAGLAADAAFAGQAMYLFVGNAATFDAATELLVLDTGRLFQATDDNVPTPQDVTINSGMTALYGGTVANIPTNGTDSTTNAGFVTAVVIPEPSTAILGGLGLIGFLARRRR